MACRQQSINLNTYPPDSLLPARIPLAFTSTLVFHIFDERTLCQELLAVLSNPHKITHFILTETLRGRYHSYTHFIDAETEI